MPPTPTDTVLYNKIKDKVKQSVNRWPSAYASGMLTKQYKEAMLKRGQEAYVSTKPNKNKGLKRWFAEEWIDIKSSKPCGNVRTNDYYPTCRPSNRINKRTPVTSTELSEKEKKQMVKKKQMAKEKRVDYKETKAHKKKLFTN